MNEHPNHQGSQCTEGTSDFGLSPLVPRIASFSCESQVRKPDDSKVSPLKFAHATCGSGY